MLRSFLPFLTLLVPLVGYAYYYFQSPPPTPKELPDLGPVIGIDLGTTYSCVGFFRSGRVEIIPNDQGNRITPSYVAFTPEGDRLIGDAAVHQLTSNPWNTVFDVKRLIGREWSDPQVQEDLKYLPFKVVEKRSSPHIQLKTAQGEKMFSPVEVSGMVLLKMKQVAETYLGQKVTHAVVTVPAYFNNAQRQATKDAAALAGLTVMRIINEPTAAAIAYGMDRKETGEKNVLVFDLGGGTFDVSILTIDRGAIVVVATNGDTHLGGEDFNHRVMEYFIKMYKKSTGTDLRNDDRAVQKLRREVEKAKRALSKATQVKVEVESIFEGKDFSETLTRAKFEELNADLFKSTMAPVKKALQDADMSVKDIDEIILVGGSTRIPKVRQIVSEFFKGKEPRAFINPDEAVAYGAAVQAAVLSGAENTDEFVLLDVNPLTLGIEITGGVMSTLIPRNTVIPTVKSKKYTTAEDDQTEVGVSVFEGERPMTADNHLLGSFSLHGIPPAKRGEPQIEVKFEIDANGILQVTAVDEDSGNKESVAISFNSKSRLSPEEMEKMLKDAEKFAKHDNKIKRRVEARNELESYTYSLRNKLIDGAFGMLGELERRKLEEAVKVEILWLEENPEAGTADLKERMTELELLAKRIVEGHGKDGNQTTSQHHDM